MLLPEKSQKSTTARKYIVVRINNKEMRRTPTSRLPIFILLYCRITAVYRGSYSWVIINLRLQVYEQDLIFFRTPLFVFKLPHFDCVYDDRIGTFRGGNEDSHCNDLIAITRPLYVQFTVYAETFINCTCLPLPYGPS